MRQYGVLTVYESKGPVKRRLQKMEAVSAETIPIALDLMRLRFKDRFVPGLIVPLIGDKKNIMRFWRWMMFGSVDDAYRVFCCTWGRQDQGGYLITMQSTKTCFMYDIIMGFTGDKIKSTGMPITMRTFEDLVFSRMHEAAARIRHKDHRKLLAPDYDEWARKKIAEEVADEQERQARVGGGADADTGRVSGGQSAAGLDGGAVPPA